MAAAIENHLRKEKGVESGGGSTIGFDSPRTGDKAAGEKLARGADIRNKTPPDSLDGPGEEGSSEEMEGRNIQQNSWGGVYERRMFGRN